MKNCSSFFGTFLYVQVIVSPECVVLGDRMILGLNHTKFYFKSFQPFLSKIGSEFGIWYALGGSRYDLFIKIKIIHLPQQFKGIYAINIGLPLIFLMNFRSFSGNSEINDDRNYFKIGKTCSSVESINRSGRKMSLKLKTIEFL